MKDFHEQNNLGRETDVCELFFQGVFWGCYVQYPHCFFLNTSLMMGIVPQGIWSWMAVSFNVTPLEDWTTNEGQLRDYTFEPKASVNAMRYIYLQFEFLMA